MPLQTVVELNDQARTGRGLLTRALPLPTGWEDGITFRPVGCSVPVVVGVCELLEAEPDRVADAVVADPVYIRQSAACSTLSRVGATDRAGERLIGTTEYGLGLLLAEGLPGMPNPVLTDATLVHDSAVSDPTLAVVDAVSCLEHAVHDLGYGGRAFLHAPARAAAYLAQASLMDGDLRSPSGHQWIISPGYPTGSAEVTLWATGPVWAAVSAVETYGEPDWRRNTDQAYTQRLALAAFDPCVNLAATFNVPACTGVS